MKGDVRPAIPLCPQCGQSMRLLSSRDRWECPSSECGHFEDAPIHVTQHAMVRYAEQVLGHRLPDDQAQALRALRRQGYTQRDLTALVLPPPKAHAAAGWHAAVGPMALVLPTHKCLIEQHTVTTVLTQEQVYSRRKPHAVPHQ